MSSWFSGATERNSPKYTNFLRGSVSYVTGSHNLKFGVSSLFLGENTINGSDNDWVNVNTIFGNPLRANGGIPFTQVPTTGCGGVSSSDHGYP